MYYWELERKDKLNLSLTIPGGVIVLIISVIIYFLGSVPMNREGIITTIFFGTLILLGTTTIFSIYFLVRAYFGYKIGFIDTTEELSDLQKNLTNYHKLMSSKSIEDMVLNDLGEELLSQYSKYTDANTNTNDRKSGFLHNSLIAIIFSLILLLVTSIPYYFIYQEDHYLKNKNTQKNSQEISNMGKNKPKPSSPPPKPKPAGGRFIKEGEVPKKKG